MYSNDHDPRDLERVSQALYAYVHTLRSFNGDWSWDPLEAAAHMFHLGRSIWVRRDGLGRATSRQMLKNFAAPGTTGLRLSH